MDRLLFQQLALLELLVLLLQRRNHSLLVTDDLHQVLMLLLLCALFLHVPLHQLAPLGQLLSGKLHLASPRLP